MQLFYPTKPAPLMSYPKDKENWIVEPKLQGWHTLWVKEGQNLRIFSRNLKEMTLWKGLKDCYELFKDAANGYYLAELLGPDERTHDVRSIQRGIKGNPMFFDYINHRLTNIPLIERKKFLKNYIPYIHVVPYFSIEERDKLKDLKFKLEGEVWKRKNSGYEGSELGTLITNDWLKIRY